MGKLTKSFREKSEEFSSSINPIVRMWIFGGIIMGFTITVSIKLFFLMFVLMVILTYGNGIARMSAIKKELEIIEEYIENATEYKEVIEEHIKTPEATLEDKLEHKEVKDEILFLEDSKIKLQNEYKHLENKKNFLKKLLDKRKKQSKISITDQTDKKEDE